MAYTIYSAEIEGVYATGGIFGFTISWSSEKGFGEITFSQLPGDEGVITIDSEMMTKEFVKAVLNKLVDDAQLLI